MRQNNFCFEESKEQNVAKHLKFSKKLLPMERGMLVVFGHVLLCPLNGFSRSATAI